MGEKNYERTRKGLKNSFVAVSLQFISILVGFFSRKIFLDYLGAEVLGLNTTAQSLLGFLNLAELGIGSAVSVTLYKPVFEGDTKTIREIISLQGWLYKRIACIIIIASLILACFFGKIFAKSDLPLWYAYASFGVMLFSSLLGYFFNYKQIILSVYQEEYKIQLSWKALMIVKLIAQAIAVKYAPDHQFLWWVGLEALFSVVICLAIHFTVHKTAPFLYEKTESFGGRLTAKYPQVVTKVKQLFVHTIGGVIITQSSPLILYAFTSLSLVGIYGNYLLITNNLSFLLASVFSGLSAGLGSVIAEKNEPLIKKLYREIYSTRFMCVTLCSICIWFLSQPFIKLWIGEQYLLPDSTLALMILNFWILNMKSVTNTFLFAYGLFSDIFSPVVEASVNIIASIVLGSIWGLNGILVGIALSGIVIHLLWKPYFLFRRGLNTPVIRFYLIMGKHLLIGVACFAAVYCLRGLIHIDPSESILAFLEYAAILFVGTAVLMEGLLLAFDSGSRSFISRIRNISPVKGKTII